MDQEIYHHGIKGMRWGIRRTLKQLGKTAKSIKEKTTDNQHADYKRTHDAKSIKKMSDAELRERINRLNMERQYSQMNPTRVSRGHEILKAALAAATTVATVTDVGLKLYKNSSEIKKIIKAKEASD